MLTTTVPSREIPTPWFRGRTIVEELVGELAASRKLLNPALVYDRQEEQWTYPDFFTPSYIQHAQEYRSAEVCTVLDVFAAAPEIETLEEMGGCDILYLPELNVDDPYYNPLFMTEREKDRYNQEGSLAILREVYMTHDISAGGSLARIKRQLVAAAVAGGYVAKSAVDKVLDWFGYHKTGGEVVKLSLIHI